MPWLDVYEPHQWTVHTISLEEAEQLRDRVRQFGSEVLCCGAESGAAANHWQRAGNIERVFFYDFEQLAMGLDRSYGVADFGVLTAEWNGHAPGALVLSVFSGVTATPPTMTAGVADTSPLLG